MNLFMFAGGSGSDTYGHIGGAIMGFVFGMAFFPRERNASNRKTKMIFMAIFLGLFVLMIGLLWGTHIKR